MRAPAVTTHSAEAPRAGPCCACTPAPSAQPARATAALWERACARSLAQLEEPQRCGSSRGRRDQAPHREVSPGPVPSGRAGARRCARSWWAPSRRTARRRTGRPRACARRSPRRSSPTRSRRARGAPGARAPPRRAAGRAGSRRPPVGPPGARAGPCSSACALWCRQAAGRLRPACAHAQWSWLEGSRTRSFIVHVAASRADEGRPRWPAQMDALNLQLGVPRVDSFVRKDFEAFKAQKAAEGGGRPIDGAGRACAPLLRPPARARLASRPLQRSCLLVESHMVPGEYSGARHAAWRPVCSISSAPPCAEPVAACSAARLCSKRTLSGLPTVPGPRGAAASAYLARPACAAWLRARVGGSRLTAESAPRRTGARSA